MTATSAFVVEASSSPPGPWQVLAESERTGGLITVGVASMPPRTPGPPLHVHSREDEATYVIDGEMTYLVGDQKFTAGPGSLVWLPRGIPHAFANLGAEPLRAVGMIVPGGLEGMFTEQAEYFASLGGEPPDPQVVDEIWARYGVRVVGPGITIE